MRYARNFLLLCVFLAGCGEARLSSFTSIASLYGVDSSFSYYHSYGDSITAGLGIPDPLTEVYPALLAIHNSLTLSNLAISGDQACDVSTRQIFPHRDSPTLKQKTLYSLLISTNDVGVKGIGAYEATFNLCQQAAIAWLAVPEEWKVFADSSSTSPLGATHLETAGNWNAVVTDALGASVTISFSRSTPGPVYVWYRLIDNSSGNFVYSLDGSPVGLATTQASTPIATQNGSTDSLALLRLATVPSGAHKLNFTQTSTGPYGVGIVAIGTPYSTGVNLPEVLVGTTPRQLIGGRGPCSQSTTPCDAYIADIRANVDLLQRDGLNVKLFDSRKYETGTSVDMIDSLHPNQYGNLEIFRSVEDALGQP